MRLYITILLAVSSLFVFINLLELTFFLQAGNSTGVILAILGAAAGAVSVGSAVYYLDKTS